MVAYGETGEVGAGLARALKRTRRLPPTDGFDRDLDRSASRRRVGPCPELDCVRQRLTPGLLAAAERRAHSLGVGADRVLISAGAITEEAYVRALAHALDLPFETCEHLRRPACPLPDERLLEGAAAGILPVEVDGALQFVVAPRDLAARRLISFLADRPHVRSRIRITTGDRLARFARHHGAAALGQRAAELLRLQYPEFSAGVPSPRVQAAGIALVVAMAGAALVAPATTLAVTSVTLAVVFLAWTGLRLLGAASAPLPSKPAPPLNDAALPVYSIIIALYDEAPAVPSLLSALRRLDYPPEKLDIKLVVEPDDSSTRAAIERAAPGGPFEIVAAPAQGPRTKPKALNAALPFVRGAYVVVYDAEDRPEPRQLHDALAAFDRADDSLACAQAALTIDNTADGWLTRLFTAEYAGLFDVFLPGMSHRHFPLPLGGSSNHFRTQVLRRVGGWDPHNVTEDADLGMRLSRWGYRTTVIQSSTYEEAPARFGPWLRQRTRWFKGWMQTWIVHMRHPLRLWRDLGPAGFVVFQLVVGGSVLSALAHPIFLGSIVYALVADVLSQPAKGLAGALVTALHAGTVIAGYLTSAVVALLGLERRNLLRESWALLLMPAHWLLLSLAAWRAVFQFAFAPHRWEKTAHGLARTSRSTPRAGHLA